jgi:hypothetical protein
MIPGAGWPWVNGASQTFRRIHGDAADKPLVLAPRSGPAAAGSSKQAKPGPQNYSAGPAKSDESSNPFAALKNLKLN